MDKFFRIVVCGLLSVVFLTGCGQQPKAQNTAKNEVVVASTPIVTPTAPADPMPQLSELSEERKLSGGVLVEKILHEVFPGGFEIEEKRNSASQSVFQFSKSFS